MKTPNEKHADAVLRDRILSAFPAGHYSMDAFFRLTDVVVSDAVETAAVECLSAPRLLLNPEFIAKHCKTDEHLFMLVMHELHHILLGHTRLFRRVTKADNIAFDAIINALLSRLFPNDMYISFFKNLYDAGEMPAALLRPPDGWPKEWNIPRSLPKPAQEMIRVLYSNASGTYKEVYDLLQKDALALGIGGGNGSSKDNDGNTGMPILLGDHSPEETPGRGEAAANHPALNGAVRSIVEKWPMPPDPIRGRSVGHELREMFLERAKPQPRVDVILKRLIKKMVEASEKGGTTKRTIREIDRGIEVPIPTLRDRRAFVTAALGWTPLVYRTVIPERKRIKETGVTTVYVDVSGSTRGYWALLASLVRPYVERKVVRLCVFSEYVVDVTPRDLARGRFETTGGTDATCIWKHAMENELKKILVLTDGYVGRPTREWINKITESKLRIRVALTPEGYRPDLDGFVEEMIELPLMGE